MNKAWLGQCAECEYNAVGLRCIQPCVHLTLCFACLIILCLILWFDVVIQVVLVVL